MDINPESRGLRGTAKKGPKKKKKDFKETLEEEQSKKDKRPLRDFLTPRGPAMTLDLDEFEKGQVRLQALIQKKKEFLLSFIQFVKRELIKGKNLIAWPFSHWPKTSLELRKKVHHVKETLKKSIDEQEEVLKLFNSHPLRNANIFNQFLKGEGEIKGFPLIEKLFKKLNSLSFHSQNETINSLKEMQEEFQLKIQELDRLEISLGAELQRSDSLLEEEEVNQKLVILENWFNTTPSLQESHKVFHHFNLQKIRALVGH